MKKIPIILIALAFLAQPVFAKSTNKDYKLPDNAVQISDNVYSLGTTYDAQSNSLVEGYAFVHKKDNAKSGGAKALKSPACYGYLATGAKWKGAPEPWIFNPTNLNGLNTITLFNTEAASIQTWENAANVNILGEGTQTIDTLTASTSKTDGKNVVYFGPISNSNTIAVTIIWGIFSGPTQNRKLVEWDQIFSTGYNWSNEINGVTGKMDFQNIATHELGHSVGMDDIYNSSCSAVTMYGYANYGETNKRSLKQADITGISNLY